MLRKRCYKRYLADPSLGVPRETKRRHRHRRLTDLDGGSDDEVSCTAPLFDIEDAVSTEPTVQGSIPAPSCNKEYMPEGDKNLTELKAADMTRGQLFALTFAFILKHRLTKRAMSDLIDLMNAVLPNCLPPNIYHFNKILDVDDSIDTHVYCSECNTYIGKITDDALQSACPQCHNVNNFCDSVKNGNFFLLYPIENSLRDVLELHGVAHYLIDSSNQTLQPNPEVIRDISDGELCTGNFPSKISLSCNIDGVPVFNSSNRSLWPVFYVINNLPLEERRKHVILHGLWFGQGKPQMNCFLQPVVSELIALEENGLQWSQPSGETTTTRVVLDLLVADSVARPLIQNFKQFNGRFGCGFCLHEGVVLEKGVGTVRTYPLTADIPEARTHAQSLDFAELAQHSQKDVSGVNGVSLLFLLPNFDIVNGFNPEYMHSVLLGVVRHFVNLWFDSTSHGKAYCLRKNIAQIDLTIVGLKPPSEIKRLPRSLLHRKHWKASEWRTFLLFYSVVALRSSMPTKYYDHWLLLVFAIYHLMEKSVRRCNLLACDIALNKFVALVPALYGAEQVSFNVHLLTHIVQSVKQWGPLWASSAFVFEDANRVLVRCVHGANAVSRQVMKFYVASKHLQPLADRYMKQSGDISACNLFCRLSRVNMLCENVRRFPNNVVAFGCGKSASLTVAEKIAIESCLNDSISSNVVVYQRVLMNGCIMHTLDYSYPIKRCDSFFTLFGHTGVYGLHRCVVLPDSFELLFLFRFYGAQQLRSFSSDVNANLLKHVSKANVSPLSQTHYVACRSINIRQKCIGLSTNRVIFFIPLPQFELD